MRPACLLNDTDCGTVSAGRWLMRSLVVVAVALWTFGANAIEPWQKVLVLGDETDIAQLLKDCEFKATVTAKGPADSLTQRLAQQTLEAGGNVVHVLGA